VVSGAKSDKTDAYALADMARTRHHQLRPVAGDSPDAAAVKVVARAHQTLIWERTRHQLRLRAGLREYFPAALQAYAELGLAAPDTLRLLALAPDPVTAARLSVTRISTVLKGARRRDIPSKATAIQDALRTPQLGQPDVVRAAYTATTTALVAVITTLNTQITMMEAQVEAHFGRHPDVEVYLSQPGLGMVLGGRVLAEFGDAGGRYADARSRKNYAGTSPLTRQSGKHATVHARFIHNNRLVDALSRQAQAALTASPGARAYYDHQRLRGVDHNAALRQLANRLVGILHGCLTTNTRYDETTAWSHRTPLAA
jgi:transposase